jgi:hypothetical protein
MQLSMNMGARSGIEAVEPFAIGDILQTKPFGRVIIESIDDNSQGQVFVCVSLTSGNTCIVLEREIIYRAR